jgi:hypothetical protein
VAALDHRFDSLEQGGGGAEAEHVGARDHDLLDQGLGGIPVLELLAQRAQHQEKRQNQVFSEMICLHQYYLYDLKELFPLVDQAEFYVYCHSLHLPLLLKDPEIVYLQ